MQVSERRGFRARTSLYQQQFITCLPTLAPGPRRKAVQVDLGALFMHPRSRLHYARQRTSATRT